MQPSPARRQRNKRLGAPTGTKSAPIWKSNWFLLHLMLAATENPPMLPPRIDSLCALDGQWWVAHTKARCEKALAWDLLENKIAFFMPMIQQTAIWGGRKRSVLKPLFPSYVFLCGSETDRYRAATTGRVCQMIAVKDRNQFVTELDAVRVALASKRTMNAYPHAAVGKRCRVTSGPLQGIEGIVILNKDSVQIVLQVSMLGQGTSLEIEADLLEPAD